MSNHALPSARKGIFSGLGNKPADLPPGTPDPVLVGKVRAYLETRYERRLGQKLADRQPVNLRILPSKTGTTEEGAENYITLQEEEVRAAIGDIFTRANGRLLVVGLPGAGKTTIVLQLALHLLRRQGASIPVVLNLATWQAEFKTFEEWLRKILPTELGASTGLAEQIRKHTPLILLLDGLDEVPKADRDSLLASIGEYGADANRQFLISSRIDEYAATKDAPVNAQIEVEPLTIEQVEMGLAATANIQPESKRLLNALKTDPLLRAAVENPFYLNTAQLLFSTGKNWSDFGFVATDVDGRQQELVERFVVGALELKVSHEYPPDKAGHWLSFLASRMTSRNMVVFELRDLQYDWWRWDKGQLALAGVAYGLNLGLMVGPFTGLLVGLYFALDSRNYFGLYIGWLAGLVIGLFIGFGGFLVIGLSTGLHGIPRPIRTKENKNKSWKNLIIKIKNILTSRNGIEDGLIMPLAIGCAIGMSIGMRSGIITGFVNGIIGCLGTLLIIALASLFIDSFSNVIQITTPYQRFIASAKSLYFSIFQHLLLRYQLVKKGLLPLHLVTFLNEMSLRHILEFDGDPHTGKGGGAWRFRHRILQEWFAERWVDPTEKGIFIGK